MALKLSNLKPAEGATRKKKRIGRGPGTGQGKQAGRGHNGQKSRSGYSRRLGFEGGQMPLIRRLPKRGFRNAPFRKVFSEVNVGRLAGFDAGTEITPELLKQNRIVRKMRDGVKVLGEGDLGVALTVHAHKFSASAREKIEAAGGKAVVIEVAASSPAETKKAKPAAKPAAKAAPQEEDSPEAEDAEKDGEEE